MNHVFLSQKQSLVFIQLCICHYKENVNDALRSVQVESSLRLVLFRTRMLYVYECECVY